MRVIVDTNIVFSALLSSHGTIGQLLLQPGKALSFYSCTFLQHEIDAHRERIIRISGLSELQLSEALRLIYASITFIPEDMIPKDHLRKADALTGEVDGDDVVFVALSLYLRAKIWTGDKRLIEGLKPKGFNRFITVHELVAHQLK